MPKSKKKSKNKDAVSDDVICGVLLIGDDGRGHIHWDENVEVFIRMNDEQQVMRVGADLVRDWIRELEPIVRRDEDRLVERVRLAVATILGEDDE